MATAADPEDQPDANQISDPVLPLQQDESPKTLTLETVQPQDKDKPDDQDDPIEEEANLDDPDLNVPSSPTSTDLQVTTTSTISTATSAVGSRRGGGPKRRGGGPKRRAQEKKSQKKLEEEGFAISPKADAFEGTNLLEAMDTADLPLTGMQIRDISSGEFLASRGDIQTVPGVSSFLGNGNKREIGHDNDFHHSPNGSSKRLRTDGLWADKSSDFEICMEQMQQCMAKARMLYAAKDQAYADSSMHQQMLVDELQRKDSIIGYLQKSKYEEQTKRQVEVYRLERELFMMENLLSGYRKALKETNQAFAEYRARCPLSEEQPLYKDVSGSGGLVVSSMELEKMRLKQEEEDRLNKLLIEKKIKDFEAGWIGKFDAHKDAVSLLSTRLIDAENDVKLLKESFANRKAPDTPECVPEES
ncbi:hypothetical protein COLO4_10076 [Corchorus olitorius]|uniref:Uncharacterized protein n=1 Tax=Corchorus olitorius TaxID=93759 RepID=A0A1R3KA31_9ROSI|nr:hypothetical protein COLO4_10076 [Corchorus olitorius]